MHLALAVKYVAQIIINSDSLYFFDIFSCFPYLQLEARPISEFSGMISFYRATAMSDKSKV